MENNELEIYESEDKLSEKYCESQGCTDHNELDMDNQPFCYGCESMYEYIEVNNYKIAGEDGFIEYLNTHVQYLLDKQNDKIIAELESCVDFSMNDLKNPPKKYKSIRDSLIMVKELIIKLKNIR